MLNMMMQCEQMKLCYTILIIKHDIISELRAIFTDLLGRGMVVVFVMRAVTTVAGRETTAPVLSSSGAACAGCSGEAALTDHCSTLSFRHLDHTPDTEIS